MGAPAPVDERFWRYVSPEPMSGCWLWSGFGRDYGMLQIGRTSKFAHRISYEIHKGNIPDGYEVDHLCKVTCCVNPDHLEAVTPIENKRRSSSPASRNGLKTRCVHGHEFSESNTFFYVNGTGGTSRGCRICRFNVWKRREARRLISQTLISSPSYTSSINATEDRKEK